MQNSNKELVLTRIFLYVVLVFLACALVLIPYASDYYDSVSMKPPIKTILTAVLYISLLPAVIAMSRLYGLLSNIKSNAVFVKANSDHLKALGYCCFGEAVIFFVFGILRPLSFLLAFAALFFGLILRVLKNVFDKAIELREENDAVI